MPAGLRCSIDIIYGFTVLVVYPWIATLYVFDFKHFEISHMFVMSFIIP